MKAELELMVAFGSLIIFAGFAYALTNGLLEAIL